jgi:chemotaxis signal transduction protein
MRTDETQVEAASQYLSFAVAGSDYGAPILKVKEILQYEEVTPVPGTPPSIRGVINVRGAVVPVVDLGVKFGKPEAIATKRSCVLVVEVAAAEALTLGVLADAVNEVVDLRPEDIEPPPSFGAGVKVDYLTGMGKVGKGFVLLIDLDRVLTASEADLAVKTVDAAEAAEAVEATGAAEADAASEAEAVEPAPADAAAPASPDAVG